MTRHRSPDERNKQILTAARKCFLNKGYFATKVDDIAKDCGLSKGGIYFHFSSKEEIFRSLVQEEFDTGMAFIDSVVETEGDILAMLLALGEHFVEIFAADNDQPRFMVIVSEMALRDEAIRAMLLELQESYIERITSILEVAMAEGQMRSVNAHGTAIVLKAMLDGVQAAFAIGYRPELDELLPAAMELLMKGLIPEGVDQA